MGYLKQLAKKRKDLKIIITSATIDTDKFSKHFDGAPIINVEGRSFPVEVEYRPLDEGNADLNLGIYAAVQEIYSQDSQGDILVFLSGEKEDINKVHVEFKKPNFDYKKELKQAKKEWDKWKKTHKKEEEEKKKQNNNLHCMNLKVNC